MKKSYLVAGGAGFLGTNLIKRLLQDGGKVLVLDNLQTGFDKNLKEFRGNKNFSFKKHDICRPVKIQGKFDYIINLACPASPPKYYKDPVKTLETNSTGTKNMLDLALKNKARYFHSSTSEVYGDPLEHPQKETYAGHVYSYCQRSCYDEGKRYAEALIWQYRHLYNVDTGLIRIFNTYGPYMDPDDGRVISTFIRQALNNQDITIQDSGKQTRSFCYVDDQIDAQIKMIHSDIEGPLNIGNPGEFTILELAQLVIKLTNSKSKIVHIPPAVSDPKQRRPDITQAKKLLKWQPKIQLEEGLKRTIEWMKTTA